MFAKPRQLETESALYDAAIKILMRRAHSVSEMKKALIRRTADEDLVQKVIARLKHNGLLDDARYAKEFARLRVEIRRQGKFRIARDLRARGIPDRHIKSALDELANETDESAIVRQRIERKLRSLRGPDTRKKIDDRKIASMYRSLLRAGFPADVVRRELRAVTREEVPDLEVE